MQKHISKLEELKRKKLAFQEQEDKIKAQILEELSETLIASNAMEIDFYVLVGGLLDVIDKAKQNDNYVEVWQQAGQKFCKTHAKNKAKKNNTISKKAKKNQDNAE